MNRKIKFRVWDKYKKQMYPISSIDYDIFSQEIRIIAVGHKNGMCTSYNKNHNSEKCDITALELMQYTGLHDKNGKELYEGDIVKITEKEKISKHKVISMKPIIADIEWSEEYLTYTLITTSVKDAFESLTDYLDEYDIEVIGNIYDNPELLGGEE